MQHVGNFVNIKRHLIHRMIYETERYTMKKQNEY